MPKQLLINSGDSIDDEDDDDDSSDFIFILLVVVGLFACGLCLYRRSVKSKQKMDYKNAGFEMRYSDFAESRWFHSDKYDHFMS